MPDTGTATFTAEALEPRKATREGAATVTETLALSFFDDPVVSWIVPDDSRRRELSPPLFAAIVESYLSHDEVYDLPAGVSAAVWAPPGAEEDEQLPDRFAEITAENVERAFEVLGLMDEVHPSEPHYYLFLLGTRPDWQGQGIGSALMRPVLETCDCELVPAYLEATSERNRALYLRHGFEVTGEIRVPDGPTMWCMWRSPRRPRSDPRFGP
jgi:ribosomal protein S18 acetylase RimI-like enzyme